MTEALAAVRESWVSSSLDREALRALAAIQHNALVELSARILLLSDQARIAATQIAAQDEALSAYAARVGPLLDVAARVCDGVATVNAVEAAELWGRREHEILTLRERVRCLEDELKAAAQRIAWLRSLARASILGRGNIVDAMLATGAEPSLDVRLEAGDDATDPA